MKEICLQNLASQEVETVHPSLVCFHEENTEKKENPTK